MTTSGAVHKLVDIDADNGVDTAQQRLKQTILDQRYMTACIRFARRHEGLTGDNPSVGAFIVRYEIDGPIIVGRGVTDLGGRPHAEVRALKDAGELARGACIYVTLEPCSHFGKTPPCANALIDAGIARVVVAVNDPDIRVSGQGFDKLRAAGIEVVTDLRTEQAQFGLAGYLTRKTKNRPLVTLKLALSSNGLMGLRNGEQVKITDAISNGQVQLLRSINDAILVGSGTVINDDPSLACRLKGLEHRSPTRIIVDRDLTISAKSQLVQTAIDHPTILATKSQNLMVQTLSTQGVDVVPLQGENDAEQLDYLLTKLADKGISTLLVEGGAMIAQSFLDAGLVDRLVLFQSQNAIDTEDKSQMVHAPITPTTIPDNFVMSSQLTFGQDIMYEYASRSR